MRRGLRDSGGRRRRANGGWAFGRRAPWATRDAPSVFSDSAAGQLASSGSALQSVSEAEPESIRTHPIGPTVADGSRCRGTRRRGRWWGSELAAGHSRPPRKVDELAVGVEEVGSKWWSFAPRTAAVTSRVYARVRSSLGPGNRGPRASTCSATRADFRSVPRPTLPAHGIRRIETPLRCRCSSARPNPLPLRCGYGNALNRFVRGRTVS